jgi:hypothetical protein
VKAFTLLFSGETLTPRSTADGGVLAVRDLACYGKKLTPLPPGNTRLSDDLKDAVFRRRLK